jgi:hypothetical protein
VPAIVITRGLGRHVLCQSGPLASLYMAATEL